jgi:hypothetical protein
VNVQSGSSWTDLSKNFRPGKYKVSIWAQGRGFLGLVLKYNNQTVPLESSERAMGPSGYWTQLNYIVNILPNANTALYFTNSKNYSYYFDDFRMHPISSSMNSYVYDKDTDALTYILDANNLATKFVYDKAGRLKETYKEVVNTSSKQGGFKLLKTYDYNYKNQ